MKLKFLGLGWKSRALLKRSTLYISINKLVALGCSVEKGDELHSYLAEDATTGRKVIVTYLDGKKIEKGKRKRIKIG